MDDSVHAETAERTTEDLLSADDDDKSGGSETGGVDRWQATKYVAPFVAIGLFDLVLLLGWGLDPLWGFMILPPILFVSVLGWIAFRTGFASDRT
ncbi:MULTISPECIES: hypothetical protein [Haloarcula]|uniref:DUF8142 domain-containing protein n=1 Tax=Haloarcula pellucida TaxID=1427151 RepID=A0A830GPY9_9EURY|nr:MULTISPECIES: hypothetical protein [Halomicroarcula]MBX0350363.1 hypothetical protein [Halomicroarcula pellucida]MDS0277536.1 hypothetical protein [Halomicroarcula sp. S1AR25-4]GGO01703.1 hypothetical protein GCM10009030_35660 [Halomicroarcula pellucida]